MDMGFMKSVEEETPFPYAHRFFRLQPSNPKVYLRTAHRKHVELCYEKIPNMWINPKD
jgi:hypothetical protein